MTDEIADRTAPSVYGGAEQSGDPARDNWRTPYWIIEQIRKWHPHEPIFDVACGVEDRVFDDGAKGRNMLAEPWPDGVLFLNPPFSRMVAFANKLRSEFARDRPFKLYLIAPFRPEVGWWDMLFHDALFTDLWCPRVSGKLVLGWQTEATGNERVKHGVFKDRVRFDPPPGIAESSPGGHTTLSVFHRIP